MVDGGQGGPELRPPARLGDLEKSQTNLRWPAAIETRVHQLLGRMHEAGERSSKSELVAALVLGAAEDPELLGEMVRRYRVTPEGDAAIEGGVIVDLDSRRPGPIAFGSSP